MAAATYTSAATSATTAVVWQFQRDDGGFSPYHPQASADIEAAFNRGNSSLTVGRYTIDLTTMQQQGGLGNTRAICRVSCTPPSPSIMAYWEWDQGRGRYVPYDITASADIEQAFMSNQPTVDLSVTPARIPYTIDFVSMHQTRHGYNTRRRVRRVPLTQPLVTFLSTPSSSSSSYCYSSSAGFSGSVLTPASSLLSTAATSAGRRSTAATGSSSPMKSKVRQTAAVGGYQRKSRSSNGGGTGSKKVAAKTTTKKTKTTETKRTRAVETATLDPLGPMSKFVKKVTSLKFGEDGPCPICMNQLSEASGFEEDVGLPISTPSSSSSSPSLDLCRLRKCGHLLHRACLLMYAQNSPDAKNGLRCPTCKKIHGVRTGDMPDGTMTVATRRGYSLPGHEGYGIIEITYNFLPGVHNGVRYRVNGFPRICYLPDSPRGRQVLQLLKVAWSRKLTFTIGTSVTTGATNTVVWNEIHHKTESTSNISGHGYPDPAYLDNVTAELAAQGVEEGDEEDSETDSDQ